jgi:hypothetical protein
VATPCFALRFSLGRSRCCRGRCHVSNAGYHDRGWCCCGFKGGACITGPRSVAKRGTSPSIPPQITDSIVGDSTTLSTSIDGVLRRKLSVMIRRPGHMPLDSNKWARRGAGTSMLGQAKSLGQSLLVPRLPSSLHLVPRLPLASRTLGSGVLGVRDLNHGGWWPRRILPLRSGCEIHRACHGLTSPRRWCRWIVLFLVLTFHVPRGGGMIRAKGSSDLDFSC